MRSELDRKKSKGWKEVGTFSTRNEYIPMITILLTENVMGDESYGVFGSEESPKNPGMQLFGGQMFNSMEQIKSQFRGMRKIGMDKKKVARELLKLAKEISAVDEVSIYRGIYNEVGRAWELMEEGKEEIIDSIKTLYEIKGKKEFDNDMDEIYRELIRVGNEYDDMMGKLQKIYKKAEKKYKG